MHVMRSKPSGIPTPRPTARAIEVLDFVMVMVGLEDGVGGAAMSAVPMAFLAVTVAADTVSVEGWGSARPMPSFGLPGSWLSRRRIPKGGRVKLVVHWPARSHSQTPAEEQGYIFMNVSRWAVGVDVCDVSVLFSCALFI